MKKQVSALLATALGIAGLGGVPAAAADSGLPSAPTIVCGNASLLDGPAQAPQGAITVPAGDNSGFDFRQAGRTYWFATGRHTLGTDVFSQIKPSDNSTYVGAPGAVLDGQNVNRYAFVGEATGVTVKYLTITDFGGPESNRDEGVLNHDGASHWTVTNNTVQHSGGAGVFIGSDNLVRNNCLKENGQYGFSMYKATKGELHDITLDGNEIAGNNTDDWETKLQCGCTGGGKFWDAHTVRVTGNYVHDNKSVGLWADTNNYDFLFEGNWIEANDAQAIFYEISYNAVIRGNVIKGNLRKAGAERIKEQDNFPDAAIYISESGGDARVPSTMIGAPVLDISDNLIQDNYNGIALWENADRFCNSPANSSEGYCTLVNPQATLSTCVAGTINTAPYLDDCRWKTQNVRVHDNDLRTDPANILPGCFPDYCGHNAILSNWGTYPDWSPYMQDLVQQNITFNQNNVFTHNHYTGSWRFMARDTGLDLLTPAQWQAAPYHQDVDSTF
ncbi:right-handed parallel beta-helix repeat-containing protein [Actinocrispum sp. NPDC049592]|uniref:right-handed parallel beta-helix repeat-containing protein n=1 Tax=Actinocrispum sp. NPDC049592 TaxID=3154835 RepID=UPI003418953D